MTKKAPKPADFSSVEFPGVYLVEVTVSGSVTVEITAGTADEAREKASDIVDDWERVGYPELDQVWDTGLGKISQKPTRYRILRDGKPYQVTLLTPGDEPREPDERGF